MVDTVTGVAPGTVDALLVGVGKIADTAAMVVWTVPI